MWGPNRSDREGIESLFVLGGNRMLETFKGKPKFQKHSTVKWKNSYYILPTRTCSVLFRYFSNNGSVLVRGSVFFVFYLFFDLRATGALAPVASLRRVDPKSVLNVVHLITLSMLLNFKIITNRSWRPSITVRVPLDYHLNAIQTLFKTVWTLLKNFVKVLGKLLNID